MIPLLHKVTDMITIRHRMVCSLLLLTSLSALQALETEKSPSWWSRLTSPMTLLRERMRMYTTVKACRTSEDVPQMYQDEAYMASRAFGIPASKTPAIKRLLPNPYAAALAESRNNTLYIDIDAHEMTDPKIRRFTMLHEMSHIKHKDGTFSHALKQVGYGIALGGIFHFLAKKSRFADYCDNPFYIPALYVATTSYSLAKGLSDAEKRADRHAFSLSGCIDCNMNVWKNTNSYLTKQELQQVNRNITRESMKLHGTAPLCDAHRPLDKVSHLRDAHRPLDKVSQAMLRTTYPRYLGTTQSQQFTRN